MGMESPKSAPQKADDSYRARSRWDDLFEPTGRWVFCCRAAEKSAEEAIVSTLSSTRSPRLAPSVEGGARDSRGDLKLLIGRGPTSRRFTNWQYEESTERHLLVTRSLHPRGKGAYDVSV
jgi:hypothetical protein